MLEEEQNLALEAENVEETLETTEETNEDLEEESIEEQVEEPIEETEEKNTEEKVKTYSEEEVQEMIKRRLNRQEKKLRGEYNKKYSKVENILNAGMGTSNIEDATTKLEDYYKEQGIEIPSSYEPKMSLEDIEVLADKEAEDIISGGYNDIVDEVDRLANIGAKDMSEREKIVFNKLAEKRKEMEEIKELASIGIFKEQIEGKDFKDFADKLNPKMSLKEKYEMYQSYKPKKEIKQIGSMKSGASNSNKLIKDFYTRDEALKFTDADYDNNPGLEEAVEKSMQKWK